MTEPQEAAQQLRDAVKVLNAHAGMARVHKWGSFDFPLWAADTVMAALASLPEEHPGPGGAAMIAAERRRQVEGEGWTPEHDDLHTQGEMAKAAVAYVAHAVYRRERSEIPNQWWPWDREWWRPSDDPIRNLVKAGALIAAEIDRLERCRG